MILFCVCLFVAYTSYVIFFSSPFLCSFYLRFFFFSTICFPARERLALLLFLCSTHHTDATIFSLSCFFRVFFLFVSYFFLSRFFLLSNNHWYLVIPDLIFWPSLVLFLILLCSFRCIVLHVKLPMFGDIGLPQYIMLVITSWMLADFIMSKIVESWCFYFGVSFLPWKSIWLSLVYWYKEKTSRD